MSVLSGISSSAGVSYATELAQTSALKRNLNNLGTAVQNGDLTSAGSILSAFIKANPQFAITSSADSQAQDPINQDFQALADAITNNLADTAKSAWTQIKSDLTAKLDGTYRFEPQGEGTLVHYELEVDLVVPIPGFVKSRAASRIMTQALRELKARAERLA